MKILTMKQGSSEWAAARLGVVTASEIDALVSPLWKVRTGQGPHSYLCTKLAERLMGYSKADTFGGTFSTDQGAVIEQLAIPAYEFQNDVKVDRVGFCVSDDGRIGASPDGLVGEDGGLEVKSPQAPACIEYFLAGVCPPDYLGHVQFSLFVTGRKWWDFMAFHRFLPALTVRVYPNEVAHDAFRSALAKFNADFDSSLAKLQPLLASSGRGA